MTPTHLLEFQETPLSSLTKEFSALWRLFLHTIRCLPNNVFFTQHISGRSLVRCGVFFFFLCTIRCLPSSVIFTQHIFAGQGNNCPGFARHFSEYWWGGSHAALITEIKPPLSNYVDTCWPGRIFARTVLAVVNLHSCCIFVLLNVLCLVKKNHTHTSRILPFLSSEARWTNVESFESS